LATGHGSMVTVDTNIAFYALAVEGHKAGRAKDILGEADFLSVQVLNEYASSVRRKLARQWDDIGYDLNLLRNAVGRIYPVNDEANMEAVRLAKRYELPFYDAVIVAVALANGATTLYSEDMHHGLVIDDQLTIIDPFKMIEAA
jgi:predicted nucleic acid-binding protein